MDRSDTGTMAGVGVSRAVPGETPQVTALVERARTGDPEAFNDLMRLFERRIISIGMQMGLSRDDALDACQEAFTRVFRYIRRFRSGHSFFKWLYRISVNVIYDQMRKARPALTLPLEEADRAQGDGRIEAPRFETQVAAADLARKVVTGLDCLSRQERIVFVLRDLQQMETVEIGRVLRLSQVTVRRHCMMARRKLRDRLFPRDH